MGHFASHLIRLLEDRGLTRGAFAKAVGRSEGNLSNILNADPARRTQYRPPLEEMAKWSEVLALNEDERAEMVELAELAHTPPRIRDRYLAMKAVLAQSRRAASSVEPYGDGPDMSSMRELERIEDPDGHPRPPSPTYPRPTPVRGGTHDQS